MTLADRLLAGEHHGKCRNWLEVAAFYGVNERTLRGVRAFIRTTKGIEIHVGGQRETKPTVQVCAATTSPVVDETQPVDEPVKSAGFDKRWGHVAALEREWQASDFRNPEQLPYEPPVSPLVHRLTREDCPDGSLILWASDIHIPIQDDNSCRLMVECAEAAGVTHGVIGGDGLDFNCLSKHPKESHRVVEHATIMEEVEPGRWLLNWFATKRTKFILGNHEGRLNRFIDDNPAFHGSIASNFAKIVDLPAGIDVVPQGGEVRLGNLSLRHTDAEFKNGSGGKHPAQKLLDMLPDQSTIGGHVHRMSTACRTTRDEDGIRRTRRAWTMGHMSLEHEHYGYVSTSPNWQQGFGFIRVWWDGDRPRFSVYQVEILRDSRDRAYFEWGGRVWR